MECSQNSVPKDRNTHTHTLFHGSKTHREKFRLPHALEREANIQLSSFSSFSLGPVGLKVWVPIRN